MTHLHVSSPLQRALPANTPSTPCQVVSEAADAAARGILHHCHALKLVTTVCDALAKDRNGKLRQFCSLYLLQARRACACAHALSPYRHCSQLCLLTTTAQQRASCRLHRTAAVQQQQRPCHSSAAATAAAAVCLPCLQILEEWHLDEYSRALDSLEPALTAAVQDAVPQARAAGRESYAAYAAVLPDRAAALLQRLNFGLQSKLNDALTQYQRGAHLASGASGHVCVCVCVCTNATSRTVLCNCHRKGGPCVPLSM